LLERYGLCDELFWGIPLFRLPSLRRFSFCNDYGDDPPLYNADERRALETLTSSATHLEFFRCGLESGMPELIAACKGLKSFIYHQGGEHNDETPWDPVRLYDALSVSRETLETLWIEVSPYDIFMFERLEEQRQYPSFANFTPLRLLHLNAFDWIGPTTHFSGKLPSSLEVLHVAYVDGPSAPAVIAGLEKYVVYHRDQTPHLREIAIAGLTPILTTHASVTRL
jgi:hypothetical protein